MKKLFETQHIRHAGILIFLWSFIIGVLVASITNVSSLLAACFLIIGSILSIVFRNKKIFLLFLAVAALSFGILRFNIKDFHTLDQVLESNVQKISTIEGIVVSEPESRENDVRFVVQTSSDLFTQAEKILVSAPLLTEISYGDHVSITGKLKKPGIIESDTGRAFDYAKYLSKDDIYYTESFAKVEVLSHGQGNVLRSLLIKIKSAFTQQTNQILPEPESSLLAGLLISGKQALPSSILDEFKRAGVVHIVVLSGYNITIIALFLRNLFASFSFRLALGTTVIGIILFTLMTGATATIVRAALMALIILLGQSFGRTYSVSRAILVAGFLMLLENPKILLFDPSFQLSFLAVIALVYVGPLVEKYLIKIPEKLGFRSIISTTIATQITVLPFLLYSMGTVSTVSLFSNILILVFIPFTMLLGFISTILAFVSSYLALPFAYISHLLLKYILFVAHILGNLSWASIQISHFPLWLMIILYVVFGFIVVRLRQLAQLGSSSPRLTNSNS